MNANYDIDSCYIVGYMKLCSRIVLGCSGQMSERKTAANLFRSAPLISDPPYIALIGQCILLDNIE